ncbi:GNAT family N-acetyltransferase [Paenibacillus sp. N1-5-1-14]|uniref:GNAT family N-acetyltransferase n=1 Tax=Paenibacillus radicibacter TaxID=2972488 RepID=UPI0021597F50|nr:GNAT family N-acetyltransferase [Paenibacillus radicibacter]MCR8643659.1 GNAT family N-acetyltransferase [Paenibacillus radicibacter]
MKINSSPISIEPMQTKHNAQVSCLLVHGFRGKFQHLTNMREADLVLFFEKLLEQYPSEPASQRIVAVQDGEVIGTMSIKWKADFNLKLDKSTLPSWKRFKHFSTWNLFILFIGLILLSHQPQAGECYIADVTVHPDHRSKGVGKLMLDWAKQYVLDTPNLHLLCLHVAGNNSRAKQLYEQLSFATLLQENCRIRHLFFNERKWLFMVQNLKDKRILFI